MFLILLSCCELILPTANSTFQIFPVKIVDLQLLSTQNHPNIQRQRIVTDISRNISENIKKYCENIRNTLQDIVI